MADNNHLSVYEKLMLKLKSENRITEIDKEKVKEMTESIDGAMEKFHKEQKIKAAITRQVIDKTVMAF